MKSFVRFVSRNKLYTAIEILGLGIALAFVVFIATFVAGELGYDKELKGTENIYLGHSESFSIQSYTVGDVLKEQYPEIDVSMEGCLSIPGKRDYVDRFIGVEIEFYSIGQRKMIRDTVRQYPAFIFQHEIDHLDGKLYTDRLW